MTLTVKYSRLASKDFAGSQGKVTEEDDGDFELSSSVITSNEKLLQTDDVVEFKGDSLDDTDVDAKRLLQLWRLENLAVPLCYFMVGLVQGITYPLINVYPLDLGATEAQQATIWFLKGLPSCLKILFGFLSDNVPIAGYRRKPYMFIGFMISVASMLVLLMFSDLSLERVANTGTNADTDGDGRDFVVVPPSNAPSILLLSGIFFVWAMGIWVSSRWFYSTRSRLLN